MLVGGLGGRAHLVFPVSLAIAALLAIVVLSYRQTVLVYESSGGAYVVAKENLGHAAEPRRGGGAADRLRADGRRLGRGRRARAHLGRDVVCAGTSSRSRSRASR